MEQAELDHKMIVRGRERYRANLTKARDAGRESTTPAGQRLLSGVISGVLKEMQDWMAVSRKGAGPRAHATKCLREVDLKVASLIACTVTIDHAIIGATLATTANAIGLAIEDEVNFRRFRKLNPAMWKDMMRRTRNKAPARTRKILHDTIRRATSDGDLVGWSLRERHRLGVVCVDFVRRSSGLIEVTNQGEHQIKRTHRRRQRHDPAGVRLTPEALDWLLKAHETHELRYPYLMPCVSQPRKWDSHIGGGYHSSQIVQKPIFKGHSHKHLHKITPEAMPVVFQSLNGLQDTVWRINSNCFAMLKYFIEERVDAPSVTTNTDLDLPDVPDDISTNDEAKQEWKTAARAAWADHRRRVSEGVRTVRIYEVSKELLNERVFMPHRLDFRGRMYPLPSFLTPQGDDLAKGLLEFYDGHPINNQSARDWLAIHGANCYGEDKVPFSERIAWVEEHEREIRECSEDPLSAVGASFWMKSDKPWCFLAWCFEWDALRTAEEAGETFISHLPVTMDGSNNGLQLFSLLLRDPVGAKSTNVLPSDTPQDVYQDVADVVTQKLLKFSEEAECEVTRDVARRWLSFVGGRVPRSACKRPVMVLPYGGTKYSANDYVWEWYDEQIRGGKEDVMEDIKSPNNPDFYGAFYACSYLSWQIWDAIQETVVAAKYAMTWLQQVAGICTEHNIPVTWESPSGFRVHQEYMKEKAFRIRTYLKDRAVNHKVRMSTGHISRARQKNGVSPNYIHSLDSAVCQLTIARCNEEGIRDFAAVHDSFGVHAAHAAKLSHILREVVVDVFSENLLEKFAEGIQDQLPLGVELPPPPAMGDLDITGVMDSKYFFA